VGISLWSVGGQASVLSENHSRVSFVLPPKDGNANRLPAPQVMAPAHVPPPLPLPTSTLYLSLQSTDRLRERLSHHTRTLYRLSEGLWIPINWPFDIRFQARQVNEGECHVLLQTAPTFPPSSSSYLTYKAQRPATSPFNRFSRLLLCASMSLLSKSSSSGVCGLISFSCSSLVAPPSLVF
jgi:hypothetical protein